MKRYRMTKADTTAFGALAKWAAKEPLLNFLVSAPPGLPGRWIVQLRDGIRLVGSSQGYTFAAAARRALRAAK